MPKRYLGNIITQNPTAPSGPYEDSTAPGVWSLAEALAYTKADLWPTAGNALPVEGIFAGGIYPGINTMQSINFSTLGDAKDFGNLSATAYGGAGFSSSTRAVMGLGFSGSDTNTLEYVTFSTLGNSQDFGDLTVARNSGASMSSSTRGVFAGGKENNTTIDYVTIASTGNATDFGDCFNINIVRQFNMGCSNGTRGVFAGGIDNSNFTRSNVMQYITIASTGNSADFGDLTSGRFCCTGFSNTTRGVFAGGSNGSIATIIDYITVASTGNATDFGDLSTSRGDAAGMSSLTRGVITGGNTNSIEYITIASTGNGADFGDMLPDASNYGFASACSSTHGGL